MRPAPFDRKSCPPAGKPGTATAPSGVAPQRAHHEAHAAPDLAARIAQARRDALSNPARAAMLLRAWMSDHG